MKAGIHPQYRETTVRCSCGNSFVTRSTNSSPEMHVELCSECHPFYTGKQKLVDTGGRVERFQRRYARQQAEQAAAAKEREASRRRAAGPADERAPEVRSEQAPGQPDQA